MRRYCDKIAPDFQAELVLIPRDTCAHSMVPGSGKGNYAMRGKPFTRVGPDVTLSVTRGGRSMKVGGFSAGREGVGRHGERKTVQQREEWASKSFFQGELRDEALGSQSKTQTHRDFLILLWE